MKTSGRANGGFGRPSPNKPGKSSSGSSVATNSELHEGAFALSWSTLASRSTIIDSGSKGQVVVSSCDCHCPLPRIALARAP